MDWGFVRESVFLRLTMVEEAKGLPYTVLCEIEIVGNDIATARYLAFQKEELDWVERQSIIQMIATSFEAGNHQIVIDDQFPKIRRITAEDSNLGAKYQIQVTVRRMGLDNGKNVFFDYGQQLHQINEGLKRTIREPSRREKEKIRRFLKSLD
jgi:hypothetical protein